MWREGDLRDKDSQSSLVGLLLHLLTVCLCAPMCVCSPPSTGLGGPEAEHSPRYPESCLVITTFCLAFCKLSSFPGLHFPSLLSTPSPLP